MRCRIILTAALFFTQYTQATAEQVNKLRQYEHVEGRSLKSYINEGYEIKSIIPQGKGLDFYYFVKKDNELVLCYEETLSVGGKVVSRDISCSRLVEPTAY